METQIGNLLSENNFTLSVAESCTAGGIASRICSVAGSSNYFMGGVISYSNESKIRELNVKLADIEKYSAVSNQVASQMSVAVREKFNTDFSVSTSGYTGPSGKEVGKVFISVSTPEKVTVKEYFFKGNRSEICQQVILESLRILLLEIKLKKILINKRNYLYL